MLYKFIYGKVSFYWHAITHVQDGIVIFALVIFIDKVKSSLCIPILYHYQNKQAELLIYFLCQI